MHKSWLTVGGAVLLTREKKENNTTMGLQPTVSNTFQAHPTKNCQGIYKKCIT